MNPESPSWDMELYGPLSLVQVTLSDLFSGEVFTYGTSFTPKQLGLDQYPANQPFPAIGPLNLPPIDTVITQDFLSLQLDRAFLNITVINQWPINIKAGSRIVLFNADNIEVTRFVLERNINANGGTYVTSVLVENISYTAKMRIEFQNFATDGSSTPVTLKDQKMEFLFAPSEMEIAEMVITDNREIPYEESNDFSLTGERIEALGVTGIFISKFANPHPFSFTNQSYLMLQDSTVIDSLFNGNQLILGTEGETLNSSCPNLTGNLLTDLTATNENPVISRDTITLNETRLGNMNRARIVKIKGFICLPKNPDNSGKWTMRKEDVISLKLIGDVKMRIDFDKNKK